MDSLPGQEGEYSWLQLPLMSVQAEKISGVSQLLNLNLNMQQCSTCRPGRKIHFCETREDGRVQFR